MAFSNSSSSIIPGLGPSVASQSTGTIRAMVGREIASATSRLIAGGSADEVEGWREAKEAWEAIDRMLDTPGSDYAKSKMRAVAMRRLVEDAGYVSKGGKG